MKIPIVAVDQHDFLEHRRNQEALHWSKNTKDSPLRSILTVELNTTELCNRTCVFCPRHDPEVFSNKSLRLTTLRARYLLVVLERIYLTQCFPK